METPGRSPAGEFTLDARGRMCPEPIRMAAARLAELSADDQLRVLSDDPASPIDFEVWCSRQGHRLLECERMDAHWELLLRKVNTQA